MQKSAAELAAGLGRIRESPRDAGRLDRIVRRPGENRRETLDAGEVTVAGGLSGDAWAATANRSADDQLTLINSRAIALIAGEPARWPLAGDQFYVDFDLTADHLPAGARLAIGERVVVEVTARPHTGCGKFRERFGAAALAFVNSPEGMGLRLRGLHAKVIAPGRVGVGDVVRKV